MQVDTPTYTPATAAHTIGVHPNVVRKWCIAFRDYLSPEANPPAGQGRKLTASDVARLQLVRQWRSDGVEFNDIAPRLAQLPANEPSAPHIDVAPELPVLDKPGQAITSMVVLNDLAMRVAALESHNVNSQRRQWIVVAAIVGAVLVGVIVGGVLVWMVTR